MVTCSQLDRLGSDVLDALCDGTARLVTNSNIIHDIDLPSSTASAGPVAKLLDADSVDIAELGTNGTMHRYYIQSEQ
jgi:hypothetical protein